MSGFVERGDVPGLVTLLSVDGEVHVAALGSTTLSGNNPVRRDTIFRISSMTKPVTAVAALMLVEDGKLRLDDPVDALLPELADRRVLKHLDGSLTETVPAARPITLRDLLTFRMGFGLLLAPPDRFPILQAARELQLGLGPPNPAELPEPDEWLRRLGSLPLMRQPGEAWLYNTGADVLGALVARSSGQPLEVFMRERIFEPLGMNDTAFSVPAAKLDRFMDSFSTSATTGKPELADSALDGQWSMPPAFPSGAAGLVSTVDDYLAFSRMLLNQGKTGNGRILSQAAVEAMTTDQLTPQQQAGAVDLLGAHRSWGLGLSVITGSGDPAGSPGAFGWDGGLGTSWLSDPGKNQVAILMTQNMWESAGAPGVYSHFWKHARECIERPDSAS